MRNNKIHYLQWLLIGTIACVAILGCASMGSQRVTTGAFIQIHRIEGELERGISSKMDVKSLLGEPDGFGSAIIPPQYKQNDVWFYENIEVADMRSVGGGYYEADYRQQILLVFFKKEVYDGFMWYTNVDTKKE